MIDFLSPNNLSAPVVLGADNKISIKRGRGILADQDGTLHIDPLVVTSGPKGAKGSKGPKGDDALERPDTPLIDVKNISDEYIGSIINDVGLDEIDVIITTGVENIIENNSLDILKKAYMITAKHIKPSYDYDFEFVHYLEEVKESLDNMSLEFLYAISPVNVASSILINEFKDGLVTEALQEINEKLYSGIPSIYDYESILDVGLKHYLGKETYMSTALHRLGLTSMSHIDVTTQEILDCEYIKGAVYTQSNIYGDNSFKSHIVPRTKEEMSSAESIYFDLALDGAKDYTSNSPSSNFYLSTTMHLDEDRAYLFRLDLEDGCLLNNINLTAEFASGTSWSNDREYSKKVLDADIRNKLGLGEYYFSRDSALFVVKRDGGSFYYLGIYDVPTGEIKYFFRAYNKARRSGIRVRIQCRYHIPEDKTIFIRSSDTLKLDGTPV